MGSVNDEARGLPPGADRTRRRRGARDANHLRPSSAIDVPVINIHAGVTPRYRGVHGGYWALREGRPGLAGSTVHLVDPGIDTGGILAQATFTAGDADSIATYPLLHLACGSPCCWTRSMPSPGWPP